MNRRQSRAARALQLEKRNLQLTAHCKRLANIAALFNVWNMLAVPMLAALLGGWRGFVLAELFTISTLALSVAYARKGE